MFCTQALNIFLILLGANNPKIRSMTLQMNIASAQSKVRCCTVSKLLQKQHLSLPCQFLLTKLSLVSIASLYNNHMKTLIFNGN
jgi:hypothetical protein